MKIKFKTKYNVKDLVVLKNYPQEGWCSLGQIVGINVFVNQFGVTGLGHYKVYIEGHGTKLIGDESSLESIESFEKRQRESGLGYSNYVRWLNEKKYIKLED